MWWGGPGRESVCIYVLAGTKEREGEGYSYVILLKKMGGSEDAAGWEDRNQARDRSSSYTYASRK